MNKSMVMFIFWSEVSLFGEKCFKKSIMFIEAKIWNQDYLEYVEFDSDFHFLSFLDQKYSFWVNLVRNLVPKTISNK